MRGIFEGRRAEGGGKWEERDESANAGGRVRTLTNEKYKIPSRSPQAAAAFLYSYQRCHGMHMHSDGRQ